MNNLRNLRSVDKLLQSGAGLQFINEFGSNLTTAVIREELELIRVSCKPDDNWQSQDDILGRVQQKLNSYFNDSLIPVINATGVILHTNLGRAPLCDSAIQILERISQGYSNLEFDLDSGKRGSRVSHTEQLLIRLTGAESAFVVNNNAAAVMLVLTALCYRKRVVISRTQLVEIGGGFRVPEVMKLSGAKLIEVGTTNRVHLSDYEDVFRSGPAYIMHAHQSNFRIVGFFSEPTMKELAETASRNKSILIDDIGSGALIDTAHYGLIHEPTVQESLSAGSDIVCFSGDKLLGGPQAGIIVGKKRLLDLIKKHPFARALRADKVCHAALSSTLIHYLKGDFERKIPVWQMINKTEDEILAIANNWTRELKIGEVIHGCSTVGGGSIPGETLPTFLMSIYEKNPDRFLERLRRNSVPIIARIENDHVVFDPRTVLPDQDELLINGIKSSLKSS